MKMMILSFSNSFRRTSQPKEIKNEKIFNIQSQEQTELLTMILLKIRSNFKMKIIDCPTICKSIHCDYKEHIVSTISTKSLTMVNGLT